MPRRKREQAPSQKAGSRRRRTRRPINLRPPAMLASPTLRSLLDWQAGRETGLPLVLRRALQRATTPVMAIGSAAWLRSELFRRWTGGLRFPQVAASPLSAPVARLRPRGPVGLTYSPPLWMWRLLRRPAEVGTDVEEGPVWPTWSVGDAGTAGPEASRVNAAVPLPDETAGDGGTRWIASVAARWGPADLVSGVAPLGDADVGTDDSPEPPEVYNHDSTHALAPGRVSEQFAARVLSASGAMPLLRLEGIPTEDRYLTPREPETPGQMMTNEIFYSPVTSGDLGSTLGSGSEWEREEWGDRLRHEPVVQAPIWPAPDQEPEAEDEIPPELAELPPLLAKLVVADARERRSRAARSLPHAVSGAPVEHGGERGWPGFSTPAGGDATTGSTYRTGSPGWGWSSESAAPSGESGPLASSPPAPVGGRPAAGGGGLQRAAQNRTPSRGTRARETDNRPRASAESRAPSAGRLEAPPQGVHRPRGVVTEVGLPSGEVEAPPEAEREPGVVEARLDLDRATQDARETESLAPPEGVAPAGSDHGESDPARPASPRPTSRGRGPTAPADRLESAVERASSAPDRSSAPPSGALLHRTRSESAPSPRSHPTAVSRVLQPPSPPTCAGGGQIGPSPPGPAATRAAFRAASMLPPLARSMVESAIMADLEPEVREAWSPPDPTHTWGSAPGSGASSQEEGDRGAMGAPGPMVAELPLSAPRHVARSPSMQRSVAPTAASGPDPNSRSVEPAVAASEEQYLDLLFGSISRSSASRPELALAPVSRPTAGAGGAEPEGARGEGEAQPGGRDEDAEIDELAQRVYGAIRLRLAVERERLGRMG